MNLLKFFFERGVQIEGKQGGLNLYRLLSCWSTLALSVSSHWSDIYQVLNMKSKIYPFIS